MKKQLIYGAKTSIVALVGVYVAGLLEILATEYIETQRGVVGHHRTW